MDRIPPVAFIAGAVVLGVIALALMIGFTPRLTTRSAVTQENTSTLQPQTEGVIKGTDSYNLPGTIYTPPVRPAPGGGTITLPAPQPEPVFCTQDAMQCPDGSYVGRTGPRCEFSPCPGSR